MTNFPEFFSHSSATLKGWQLSAWVFCKTYRCLIITQEELKTLLERLPENIEIEYDEEGSKQTKRSIYCLTARGKSPLGDIDIFLYDAIGCSYEDRPEDLGYDTDSNGVGFNTVYLSLEE